MSNPNDAQALNQMLAGAWVTQGIHVAAELGLADQLINGPLSADELAPRVKAHAGSLYRLLRALASFGIFSEDNAGKFSLTPMAQLLRSDSPEKKHAFARLIG